MVDWMAPERMNSEGVAMRKRVTDVDRPWWRKLLAMVAPSRPDLGERLAQHYRAEIRLARFLAQDAEALTRYPHQSVLVLDASEHAGQRARRIRGAFEGLAHPVTEVSRGSGQTAWERLRANISDLSEMSEAYLADAFAVERGHPEISGLLLQLHKETAGDRRDLVWVLAQLEATGVEASLGERVA